MKKNTAPIRARQKHMDRGLLLVAPCPFHIPFDDLHAGTDPGDLVSDTAVIRPFSGIDDVLQPRSSFEAVVDELVDKLFVILLILLLFDDALEIFIDLFQHLGFVAKEHFRRFQFSHNESSSSYFVTNIVYN